jgi:hypothetical protein
VQSKIHKSLIQRRRCVTASGWPRADPAPNEDDMTEYTAPAAWENKAGRPTEVGETYDAFLQGFEAAHRDTRLGGGSRSA